MKGIHVDRFSNSTTSKIYQLATKTLSYLDSASTLAGGPATVRKEALYKRFGELQMVGTQVFEMLQTLGYVKTHPCHITRTEKESPWDVVPVEQVKGSQEKKVLPAQAVIQKAVCFSPTKTESKLIDSQYLMLHYANQAEKLYITGRDLLVAHELVQSEMLQRIDRNNFSITAFGRQQLKNTDFDKKLSNNGIIFFCMAENCVLEGDKHIIYTYNSQICQITKTLHNKCIAPRLIEMDLITPDQECLTDKGVRVFRNLKDRYQIESDRYRIFSWSFQEPTVDLKRLNRMYNHSFLVLKGLVDHVVNANGKYLVAYNRETIGNYLGRDRLYVQRCIDELVDRQFIERSGRNKLYVFQKGIDAVTESLEYIRKGIPCKKVFTSYFNCVLFMLEHTINCYDYKMVKEYIPHEYQSHLPSLIEDGIIVKVGIHYCFTKEGYHYALAAKMALKV